MQFNRLLPYLLVIISGLGYVRTLMPGIGYSGDAAKFAFAGYVWGTAHANGYPTYLILNHFFTTLLPFGSIAYRANLLSAVFTVIGIVILYRIFILLKVQSIIAFVICLAFAFTRTLWSQSAIAEVYTLHVLFVSLVFYFFLRWNINGKQRDLLLACGFYAFSFGNNLSMITLLPGIIYLTLATNKQLFIKPSLVLKVAVLILLGALQYYYSIWRYYDPATKYLEIATPDLKTLWWAIKGAQFGPSFSGFSFSFVFGERLPRAISILMKEFFYLTPIALFGIKRLNAKLNLFFLIVFVVNLFLSLNLGFTVGPMYFLPNFLIIAIYLGLAFDLFYEKLSNKGTLKFVPVALCSFLPLILLFTNYSKVDQHKNTLIADTAKKYLKMVHSNALLISPGYDVSEYLWYYLIGEGLQEKTQIYVAQNCSIDQVKNYVQKNTPIYLPIQRINTPIGLQVYCLGPNYVEGLRKAGLKVRSFGPGLFKVSS